ncbi:siderophore iron transporter, partial [Fusarium albosuccineum]
MESKSVHPSSVLNATEPSSYVQENEKSDAYDAAHAMDEPPPRLGVRTFLAIFAVCSIYFSQLVTLVGVGAQGQTIAGHFNSSANVVWLSSPITILTVVLSPIVSRAADYWGRKWFLVTLTVFGGVGSIIIARADSMAMAIAGSCITGVCFGVQPLLHAVTSEVLPRRWRAWAQATDMISNGLGSITGLLVGGALNRANDIHSEGFRTYFLMAMGCYFMAALLTWLLYSPPPTAAQKTYSGRTRDKLRMLDWMGFALLASGLVLFCTALSWSQNPYPWGQPRVSATFAIGVSLCIVLVIYEVFFKKDGMFHHGLFSRDRSFALATFCVFIEGVAFFAANNYFAFQVSHRLRTPQASHRLSDYGQVSVLYETDSLIVGVRYSIMLICSMVGASVAGVYCAITRKARWLTVLGFLISVAFFACMATTGRKSNQLVWATPILLGFALGITLATLVTVAQLCTPPELIAAASGLVISMRSLGGSIGLAIYNALFNHILKSYPDNIANAAQSAGLDKDSLMAFVKGISTHNQTALEAIPGVNSSIIK